MKNWKKEYQKCRKSAYYFYTNYVIINGKPATTLLSEKDFNNLAKQTPGKQRIPEDEIAELYKSILTDVKNGIKISEIN